MNRRGCGANISTFAICPSNRFFLAFRALLPRIRSFARSDSRTRMRKLTRKARPSSFPFIQALLGRTLLHRSRGVPFREFHPFESPNHRFRGFLLRQPGKKLGSASTKEDDCGVPPIGWRMDTKVQRFERLESPTHDSRGGTERLTARTSSRKLVAA